MSQHVIVRAPAGRLARALAISWRGDFALGARMFEWTSMSDWIRSPRIVLVVTFAGTAMMLTTPLRPLRRVGPLALLATLLVVPVHVQTRTQIDVSKLGPQVGERVPDFTLVDQTGRQRTLQSIMGPRGAMLVFVRSADW